jgi:hypothetical protein
LIILNQDCLDCSAAFFIAHPTSSTTILYGGKIMRNQLTQDEKAAANPVAPIVVNTAEARQMLGGIGRSTLIRLTESGKLKARKVGMLNMYAVKDIRALLGL